MKYTIHKRLWAHLVYTIRQSPDFRKDIVYGLEHKDGKLVLNQVGLDTCTSWNIPGSMFDLETKEELVKERDTIIELFSDFEESESLFYRDNRININGFRERIDKTV